MILSRKKKLRPLIESTGGIHLTAYLVNRGDLIDLKRQIEQTLHEAYEWLHEALPPQSREKLLQPIYSFSENLNRIDNKDQTIGIFRNEKIFEVIQIPIETNYSFHVANSFHTKPIFRWFQNDPEFFLLHQKQKSLDVYWGSLNFFKKVDSYFINEKSLEATIKTLSLEVNTSIFYLNENVSGPLNDTNLTDFVLAIRKKLKHLSEKAVQKALFEFEQLASLNLTKKNIFQIAKAASQSRIKKIIVAEDFNIFGKLDSTTGGLAIHPIDLDCEDDDILDDLAQKVYIGGGEVIIAKRNEIPENRPVLAILQNPEGETKNIYHLDHSFIKSEAY